MDPVTDILRMTAVRGSLAATIVGGDSWGLGLEPIAGAAFHAVVSGVAEIHIHGRPAVRLVPGDTVLLPRGPAHVIASGPGAPVRPFDPVRALTVSHPCKEIVVGHAPLSTRILCAAYQQDPAATFASFSLLPDVVHIPSINAPPVLRSSLQMLSEELSASGPGARAVLDHIVNILLIQVLRAWITETPAPDQSPSWLRGLADPIVRAALTALHEHPSRPWTVSDLARSTGVSRATLARRFVSGVGQTPSEYLSAWRMELAGRRLRDTDDAVGVIARGVGYTSEYAFNRAFNRRHGSPPGRYRQMYKATQTGWPSSPESMQLQLST